MLISPGAMSWLMLGPGTVIGRYVVLSPLASGERSVVYRAREMSSQHEVALKLFKQRFPNAEAIVREYQPQFLARQPNIVGAIAAHSIVCEADELAVIMQLLDAQSLDDLLVRERPGPWQPMHMLNLLKPVIETLMAAHESNMVHGNVKPSNVLLDRSTGAQWPGTARLGDWGGASLLNQHPNATRWPGLAPYMAPEQLSHRVDAGPPTDVFAVGMLIWRFIVGRAAVDLRDSIATRNLYSGLMPIPRLDEIMPSTPTCIADAVEQAVSINPGGRHRTMRQLWMHLIGQPEHLGHRPTEPKRDPNAETRPSFLGESPADDAPATPAPPTADHSSPHLYRVGEATAASTPTSGPTVGEEAVTWEDAIDRSQLSTPTAGSAVVPDDDGAQGRNEPKQQSFEALLARIDALESARAWPAFAAAVEASIPTAPDDAQRGALYKRLGSAFATHIQDHERAIVAYRAALELDPSDDLTARRLEASLRRAKDWVGLTALLRPQLATVQGDELLALLLRIAGLYERRLNEPAEAADLLWQVLEMQPGHDSALNSLESIYEKGGQWRQLLALLKSRLDAAETSSDAISIRFQIAGIYDGELANQVKACEIYETILDDAPSHLPTLNALETLYRAMGDHPALAQVYLRQAAGMDVIPLKLGILGSLIALIDEHIEDPDLELQARLAFLDLQPDDETSLRRVAELSEGRETQDHVKLGSAMRRLADRTTVSGERAQLLARASGEFSMSGDLEAAIEAANEGVASAPSSVDALRALYSSHVANDDSAEALQALERLYAASAGTDDQADLGHELAVCLHDLGSSARAISILETVLGIDPEHAVAAVTLGEFYAVDGRVQDAGQLLESISAHPDLSPDVRFRTERGLAGILEKIDQPVAAVTRYDNALLARPLDADCRVGRARALLSAKRTHKAIDALFELTHDESVAKSYRVVAFVLLGDAFAALGDDSQARNNFEEALKLEPTNPAANSRLLDADSGGADSPAARLSGLFKRLETVEEATERSKVLRSIAKLQSELGKVGDAIQSLQQAHEAQPRSRTTLVALIDALVGEQRWAEVVPALVKLADHAITPDKQSALLVQCASICTQYLNDPRGAVDLLESALQADPNNHEPLEVAEALLIEIGDNARLEQTYRCALDAIDPTDGTTRHVLFRKLGELYEQLGKPRDAIDALQAAAAIRPDDDTVLANLGRLYDTTGHHPARISAQYRRIVANDFENPDGYRELFLNMRTNRDFDGAWCAASCLVALDEANDEEAEFYQKYRSTSISPARQALEKADWRVLTPRDCEPRLTTLLVQLGHHARVRIAEPLGKWEVDSPLAAAGAESDDLGGLVHYLGHILGLPKAQVWVGSLDTSVTNANADPASLIVSRDVIAHGFDRVCVGVIARGMGLLLPQFYLASVLSDAESIASLVEETALWSAGQELEDWAAVVRGAPAELKSAARAVHGAGLHSEAAVTKWLRLAELTLGRVGLVLSGDPCAMLPLASIPVLSDVDATVLREDILSFAISEDHLKLRRKLGINVG